MSQTNHSTSPAPGLKSLTPQQAVLGADLEFHYVEQGLGTPLVFIHGGSGDYGSWHAQWEAFTPHFRTITYSRRFSRPNRNDPAGSPNHSALVDADDLARLLVHWNAAPAILVGSSYGALTALALAVKRPELVRAMILSEPPLLPWADRVPGGQRLREQYEREVQEPARAAFERGDDLAGATLLASGILGQSGLHNLAPEARARRFGNVLPMKVLALSAEGFPSLDATQVAALAMPILLLSGQGTQPILAACFAALCSVLPSAEVHRLANCGHSVYREQPEVHNTLALAFLRRHGLL
jgi:pimeloyl-ACP methyl ester carboxylesterase